MDITKSDTCGMYIVSILKQKSIFFWYFWLLMVQSSLLLRAAYTLTNIILSHLVYWHKSKFIVIIKNLHHRSLSNLFIAKPFYWCIKAFITNFYCFHFSHSFVVLKLAKSTPIPWLPVHIANPPNKVVLRTMPGTFLRCIIRGWWPSVRPLPAPTLAQWQGYHQSLVTPGLTQLSHTGGGA